MRAIQDWAAGVFLAAVAVLTVVSVLGVWDFFSGDVITKSFETIGLLGGVAAIVIIAGRYLDSSVKTAMPHPVFKEIRQSTLGVLIVCAALLALTGVLSIWQIVARDILHKSISSLAILGFAALIMVIVCLEREDKIGHGSTEFSIGRVAVALLVFFLLSPVLFWILALSAFH